jgi:hypothetical protein
MAQCEAGFISQGARVRSRALSPAEATQFMRFQKHTAQLAEHL